MYTLEKRVYRPPLEANSALLEVSLGCSYGKCTFCRYANGETPLQLLPAEILGDNLAEMADEDIRGNRMYLLGGNVLAFKAKYLIDVFQYVQSYLPQITQFSMYGRADDVLHKTDSQLESLRQAGLHMVYIGVESGNREILKNSRKGETPDQIVTALHKLDKMQIHYGLSSILGLGGQEMWRRHALDTADLYNRVRPDSIRVMTLTAMPGTPLERNVQNGRFKPASPHTILQEEALLLQNIRYADHDCWFAGTHVSNSIPLEGSLLTDKQKMLVKLKKAIKAESDQSLQQSDLKEW